MGSTTEKDIINSMNDSTVMINVFGLIKFIGIIIIGGIVILYNTLK